VRRRQRRANRGQTRRGDEECSFAAVKLARRGGNRDRRRRRRIPKKSRKVVFDRFSPRVDSVALRLGDWAAWLPTAELQGGTASLEEQHAGRRALCCWRLPGPA